MFFFLAASGIGVPLTSGTSAADPLAKQQKPSDAGEEEIGIPTRPGDANLAEFQRPGILLIEPVISRNPVGISLRPRQAYHCSQSHIARRIGSSIPETEEHFYSSDHVQHFS